MSCTGMYCKEILKYFDYIWSITWLLANEDNCLLDSCYRTNSLSSCNLITEIIVCAIIVDLKDDLLESLKLENWDHTTAFVASLVGELKKMADLVSNMLHQSALENGNPQKQELAKTWLATW